MKTNHYDRFVETLSSAAPGFEVTNKSNGRRVVVLDTDRFMYYCSDRNGAIHYSTSSEDDAYRWLSGTLFAGWDSKKIGKKPILKR